MKTKEQKYEQELNKKQLVFPKLFNELFSSQYWVQLHHNTIQWVYHIYIALVQPPTQQRWPESRLMLQQEIEVFL